MQRKNIKSPNKKFEKSESYIKIALWREKLESVDSKSDDFMLKRISDKALEYENYLILLLIPIFLLILTGLVRGDVGYWTEFWWMFPVSIVIATVVNTVGISGAALFVPFFALVFPALAFGLTPGGRA